MDIYLVGGAVRDHLLSRLHPGGRGGTHHDRDWVVVGATPSELVALGYQPVGHDFPVFLHPSTREEYALARTERKSGPGHRGFTCHFSPGTTLEEDLARRDLTINAMAWPRDALPALLDPTAANGLTHLIDPYGGWADLQQGVLRHVTMAFTEDPLRVLRVARFAARWPTFELAPDTSALMQHMAQEGELKHLVAERVWQELAKGLQATQPSRMLQVLAACGAWSDLLDPMPHGPVSTAAVDLLAQQEAPLASRFASLWWQATPEQLALFCLRHRVPKTCESVTEVALRGWPFWVSLVKGDVSVLWALLQSSDALRRPERLAEAARCWMAWSAATGAATATQTNHTRDHLLHALQAAQQTRLAPSTPLPPGPARGDALARAREQTARSAWSGFVPEARPSPP